MDGPTEIPKFDLAEQIMAEQRKVAATRRKGPGRKANTAEAGSPKPQVKGPKSGFCLPASGLSVAPREAEHIIAEIVARDIRQLCGDNVSGIRG